MSKAHPWKWPVIGLFILLLVAAIEITVRLVVFKDSSAYNGVRNYVLSTESSPQYRAQPFLNYMNFPGMPDPEGVSQINRMGLRHRTEATLPKPAENYRMLFLGGSTTFGEVDTPEEAFPAIVQETLNHSEVALPSGARTVECLNGGMGAATSAEIFTHYLMRYRYLDADMVVIHAGINDAFAYPALPGYVYQPDYHTSKRVMQDMPTVTPALRLLCRSFTLASILIPHYFPIQVNSDFTTNDFFDYHNRDQWLASGNVAARDTTYNAFYRNLQALIKLLKEEGKAVLLVTEVVEYSMMPVEARSMLEGGIEWNAELMTKLAAEMEVPLLKLDKAEFPPDLFIANDGIHVNGLGEQKKAERITAAIRSAWDANVPPH
ncbi:MAG: SGNH/GDSL hydrolase family protein [Flavobacteriales bacterium]|nr:SGNH/GDSL hydrolase family protein [Flavobacteriales bacterium]